MQSVCIPSSHCSQACPEKSQKEKAVETQDPSGTSYAQVCAGETSPALVALGNCSQDCQGVSFRYDYAHISGSDLLLPLCPAKGCAQERTPGVPATGTKTTAYTEKPCARGRRERPNPRYALH